MNQIGEMLQEIGQTVYMKPWLEIWVSIIVAVTIMHFVGLRWRK